MLNTSPLCVSVRNILESPFSSAAAEDTESRRRDTRLQAEEMRNNDPDEDTKTKNFFHVSRLVRNFFYLNNVRQKNNYHFHATPKNMCHIGSLCLDGFHLLS
jgi:hypothetical protein